MNILQCVPKWLEQMIQSCTTSEELFCMSLLKIVVSEGSSLHFLCLNRSITITFFARGSQLSVSTPGSMKYDNILQIACVELVSDYYRMWPLYSSIPSY